jgi:hypothetical protein
MKGERRWPGLRVWVADADGKKRNGTLWWTDEASLLICEDGRAGALEGGERGFAEDGTTSDGGR